MLYLDTDKAQNFLGANLGRLALVGSWGQGAPSPPKLLNGLSLNFQEILLQTPSCASSHYFSNMSNRLSVNQSCISLSYFHYDHPCDHNSS